MNKPTEQTTTPTTPDTREAAHTSREFTVDAPAGDEDISVVAFERAPLTDINFGF